MRKSNKALLMLAASLMAAGVAGVSCSKDLLTNRSGFQFTARLSKVGTKTDYSGQGTVDGNGNLTNERINWRDNDLIRIYSPQAVASSGSETPTHIADYQVVSHSEESETSLTSVAKVAPMYGDGLCSTEEERYDFYAAYPSPSTGGMPGGVSFDVSGEDGTVSFTGVVPADQEVFRKDENGSVYLPEMRYGYMVASQTNVVPGANGEFVDLGFYPKFSAFEFTVSAGDFASVTLRSFELESTSGYLTGSFVIPQGEFGPVETAVGGISNGGKKITVDFGTEGLTFTNESPLTIAVIALAQEVSGVKVSFTGDEIGSRSLELKKNGSPIAFGPYRKHKIKGLRFPSMLDVIIVDPIVWDGEYWSQALIEDPIIWDGEYASGATIGDDITWTTDYGMNGPFGGLYLSKGYLVKTADGYGMSGDDQLEVLKYYEAASVTSLPQYYHAYETTMAGASVEGFTVPTQAEWESIIGTTRTGAKINGETGKHYAKVTIDLTGTEYESYGLSGSNTIKGLLLFPDGAEIYVPELLEIEDLSTVLDNADDDFSVALTYERLKRLCGGAQGCAFLPCAGKNDSGWTQGGTGIDYLTVGMAGGSYPVRMVK